MKKYMIIGDGESPHIVKWVKELAKHFEVYLVSSRGVEDEIRDHIPGEQIFDFNLSLSESGDNYKFFRMLRPVIRIIKKTKPDFVNAHYVTSHGFIAALAHVIMRKKFFFIITAWGTDVMVTPFRNTFYNYLTRFTLKQAFLVTTDSRKVADLVRHLSRVRTTTFPFGLERLPDVNPAEKDYNFFFSNRTLNANSNIDRVLGFFRKVHDINPEARLIIGNNGPLRPELEVLSEKLGLQDKVKFVGFVSPDKQSEYYRRSGFYFSVLTSDALSVSLLEAMAFGCIPIVSNLADNTEWVKHRKNGVVMTETTDPGVLESLKENAQAIFTENRRRVMDGAIFPDSVSKYVHELNELLNKRNAHKSQ